MGYLKRMARDSGHVVIASIHQPRSAIWSMFDKVRTTGRCRVSSHTWNTRRAGIGDHVRQMLSVQQLNSSNSMFLQAEAKCSSNFQSHTGTCGANDRAM